MSKQELLVSIILPIKDGDPVLLDQAISSVLSQSYTNFELLLIDDGSKADYASYLDKKAEQDSRIRLFHIALSGVSVARNYAIDHAAGDILTFLDSDDSLSPYCLEEAISLLRDSDLNALWGGTFYGSQKDINNHQQTITGPTPAEILMAEKIDLTSERAHLTKAECVGEPYRFGEHGYINRGIAARFLKKECFAAGKNRFPVGIKMYEDAIWNLQMLSDLRISYVPVIWYYYLENESSVSNIFHEDALERMEIPLKQIASILDLDDSTEYKAYTRLLMDSLRYVYQWLYGNPQWTATQKERNALKDHIYNREPWREIAGSRFTKYADARDRKKALLFRLRLLFFYWKLT
ncbi:MAG: glycosyltransferase [Aeriscardovia sp.]|nr:glycosyltransferase [Aeriscardovia sp.]MBR2755774.1 glycosyltransferase [Lachnospiraceae bacterium]